MTALSAPRPTKTLETGIAVWRTFPVAADAIIYPGSLVAINASGYLVPASSDTTLRVCGVAVPTVKQQNQVSLTVGSQKAYVDATGLSNGDLECEVQSSCIALYVNSGSSITLANVGDDCYAADDQTVARTAGTLQVTEATISFNGTDAVGLYIDGILVQVPCATDGATTIDNWLLEFAKYDQLKKIVTATDGTTKIVLTFKTAGKHSVESYSPATADFSISHTTAGVAASRPRAGKVHHVETQGVWVAID